MSQDRLRAELVDEGRRLAARIDAGMGALRGEFERRVATVVAERTHRSELAIRVSAGFALLAAVVALVVTFAPIRQVRADFVLWCVVFSVAAAAASASGAMAGRLRRRVAASGGAALVVEREGLLIRYFDRRRHVVLEARDGRRRAFAVSRTEWNDVQPGDVVAAWNRGGELLLMCRLSSLDPDRRPADRPHSARRRAVGALDGGHPKLVGGE